MLGKGETVELMDGGEIAGLGTRARAMGVRCAMYSSTWLRDMLAGSVIPASLSQAQYRSRSDVYAVTVAFEGRVHIDVGDDPVFPGV